MAIYVVGDIHGKDFWKQLLPVWKDGDKAYFTGDFFDLKHREDKKISFTDQLQNFYDICDFAYNNYGRVFFCIGNHDVQYFWDDLDRNNGFEPENAQEIKLAFMSNMDLFRYYYVEGNWLISHAGVSKQFVSSLEELDRKDTRLFGYSKSEGLSPTWIRPTALCGNEIDGYNQIVGHTPVPDAMELEVDEKLGNYICRVGKTWFVDTVGMDIFVVPSEKKVQYDKASIMKEAALLRKSGLNKSQALKEAWRRAKAGN